MSERRCRWVRSTRPPAGSPQHCPAAQETYGNGLRQLTYRAPDGNEFGVGGAAAADVADDQDRA